VKSGIGWLGDMPAHWKAMPIRFAARLESGHTPSRSRPDWWENCTVPWFSLADVWQIRQGANVVYDTAEKISELGLANSSARRLPKGTVMLSRTASVGFSAIMGTEMATTQDFANWVCGDELLPEFLLQVLRSMSVEYRRLMMGSTHNTIYMPDIQALRFALPPIAEQQAIATFLDRETAKIDALVAEQKRLIALLKEKRQAVISHAVSKGLDPNVPMKDSGVEWLGKVPAHWVIVPLKHVVNFRSGGTPDKTRRDYWDGDVPWASAKDLKIDALFDTTDHITNLALEEGAATKVNAGSVLVVVRGMILARTFPVVTAKVDMAINQDLKAVTTREHSRNDWLAWLLRASSVETLSRLDEAGHGTKALRMDAWGDMRVAVPSSNEQERIATFLLAECERIDTLVSEAELAITLLAERRTSLISAAVTGKIDVRGLAPQPESAAA
jgi:type I restriction enzyme S subunit